MIKTIFGLILLLVPFLLIHKFEDKKLGFAYILSFMIFFHLIVAVATQALGIFSYFVVVLINLILALFILIKINFKEFIYQLKKIKLSKINWILVFVIIILFIQLYSVHYNYTGEITTVLGFTKVEGMKYTYPYFSDEWTAVSLIKYSIETNKLPLKNPLWHNAPFPNFELPFHSFISEIILLLDLNPLTQYVILTIFSGLIICLLVYFILRVNKVSKIVSAISCLSVLYIVNGANLPGIWNLMPLTLGIISFFLGFLFMSLNKRKMSLLMAFLTLIFYPPLFIIHSVGLVLYFIFAKIPKKKKIKLIFLYLILCAIVAILLFIFAYVVIGNLKIVIHYIDINLYYQTFTKNSIPDFSILKVLPIPILLLSLLGFLRVFRKKIWLVATVAVGLIFWLIYSKTTSRLIIEYARIVVVTSILIVILAGFGLHYLIKYLRKFEIFKKYKILEVILIVVLIFFLVFSFSYTERENWKELKLYSIDDEIYFPGAPANKYLHEDDLKLFENINEKNFLSVPWKGLVIGTATNNFPLLTKESTITVNLVNYNRFMESDCNKKTEIALRKTKIDYVYSEEFNCPGFEIRGVSSEGFHLYEVVSKS
jgi:hypothetical protein